MRVLRFALISKILLSFLLVGLAASAAAHTYFFGVTEINLNKTSKHIEIIHQFTAHDIENTIAESKQINFSPEHRNYDQLIQTYFEKHFSLMRNDNELALNWVGFEVKRGQIFAYQESERVSTLSGLLVKNTILTNTYIKQVNTVNYQDFSLAPKFKHQGSLTFNNHQAIGKIEVLPSQINISYKKP